MSGSAPSQQSQRACLVLHSSANGLWRSEVHEHNGNGSERDPGAACHLSLQQSSKRKWTSAGCCIHALVLCPPQHVHVVDYPRIHWFPGCPCVFEEGVRQLDAGTQKLAVGSVALSDDMVVLGSGHYVAVLHGAGCALSAQRKSLQCAGGPLDSPCSRIYRGHWSSAAPDGSPLAVYTVPHDRRAANVVHQLLWLRSCVVPGQAASDPA